MASIITSNQLGLLGSSANVLGLNGQLGSAVTGLGGDQAYVNAATGNLTLQRQDEILLGLGPDIGVVRTYNSQGQFDFDANVDNWQLSLYRRVFDVTGTVNQAGSTVKRTAADGSEMTYIYDDDTNSATHGKYVTKEGAGSFDTLTYNSTDDVWVWQDGDSRIEETYEVQDATTYRISTVTDTDGNALSYTYDNNNLITAVQSANGGRTELIYNGNDLTQVNVLHLDSNNNLVTTTRVSYGYDGNNRLQSVTTDLTPDNSSDSQTYVTTYGYDTNDRITSISNSDGTGTNFGYDGAGRIQTVTDGTNNVTTYTYVDANTTTISVTDNNGQTRQTTLSYDANKQLTRIQGPAGSGQDISYSYDVDGNVSSMTDSRGNTTTYQYDEQGNRTRQEDSLGNTITWTYDDNNQVTTETTYRQADTNPGDNTYDAGTAQTTRYAYDSESHLRFIISPEGRVTEYRYAADGTRTSAINYTDNLYTAAGDIDQAIMSAWVDTAAPAPTPTPTPSPVPGPSPTPSPSPASGSSSVLYAEDFNGATADISISTTSNLSIADAGTSNGRIAIGSAAVAANNWPGFSGADGTAYTVGQVLKAEVHFGADSNGREFSFGLNGTDTSGESIYYRAQFSGNSFNVSYHDTVTGWTGSWAGGSTGSTAIDPNTTYIVEFETAASSTTIYVYKQGETRADGFSYTQTHGVTWNTYGYAGTVTETPDGQGLTDDSIDNIEIIDTTAGGSTNSSPTVTLAALNATYTEGEAITLTATAADSDGTVASVAFYDGSILLSTVTNEPYTYTVTNAAVGSHAYTAVAMDDDGATTVSAIATVTVNAPAPSPTPAPTPSPAPSGGIDKTTTQRTDYSYDVRGQLSSTITYGTVDTSGNGIEDNLTSTVQYTYDQYGNLTQTISARGVATTGDTTDFITSYAYDGLHRIISSTDAEGYTTTTLYDDNNRQVSTTLANNLVTTSTYDLAGRLINVSNGQSGAISSLGETQYLYDTLGQLRRTTDATGQHTYYLYDDLGRQVGMIDANNNLTETVYNDNGQVSKVIQYANPVSATLNATTAETITMVGVTPSTTSADRISYNVYDGAGRLVKQINAVGAVTTYQYDGADQLIGTVSYANLLTSTQMDALAAQTNEIAADDVNTIPVADSTRDRTTRSLYSADGLLLATLDSAGYLTEHLYDAVGQRIQSIVYATITAESARATGDLAALRPVADAINDQSTYFIYDNKGQLAATVDPQGYLTEYQYDLDGNRIQTIRYSDQVTYTIGTSLDAIRPAVNVEDQILTNSFDQNNRLQSSQSQPDGLETTYTYDNVGNLIATVNSFIGATTAQERGQRQEYDQLGRVTRSLSGEGVLALDALYAAHNGNPPDADVNNIWNSYGTRYSYDQAGRVVIATMPNSQNSAGNKTYYYYDNEGKLIYEINPVGEVIEYGYNSFDERETSQQYKTRLDSATLGTLNGGFASDIQAQINALAADGTIIAATTQYDNAGRIISVTDALNDTTSRTYNAFGEIATTTTEIDDNNSVATRYAYDQRGLVNTTTEDDGGLNRITSVEYDAFGRITQTTDGEGGVMQYQYDRLGREVQVTDARNITRGTTYDAFSRVLTRTDGNNHSVSYSYDSANRTSTMTTAEGISITTEKNRYGETVKVTDGRGNDTTYTYNADGQLKTTTTASGTTEQAATSTSTNDYDSAGQLIKTTDARGIETHFTYDAANRLLTQTVDPTSANPSGLNLETEYRYDALGRHHWLKDANGIWTRTDYNDKGQVIAVVVDPSNIPDANGTPVTNPGQDGAAPLNLTTSYTYDGRGKRLTVTEGAGSANPKTTQYVYDKLGRLSQSVIDPGTGELNITTSYQYDDNDNVLIKTDANGHQTVYRYDANNRLTHTVDPLGYVSANQYDDNGNLTNVTHYATALSAADLSALQANPQTAAINVTANAAQDQTTTNAYDQDNRLDSTTNAQGIVTRYTYDNNGNQTQVIENADDPDQTKRRTTTQAFDAANRKIAATDPTGNTTSTTYDAAGNITSVIDPLGNIGYFYYDAAGRMVHSINPEGAVTEQQFDALGNITETIRYANTVGGATVGTLPAIVVDSTQDQRQVISYDAASRQSTIQTYWGAGANDYYTESMTYDGQGNILTQVARNGAQTTYTYDAAGRKATETLPITSNGSAVVNTFAYDGMGNLTTKTEAAGLPEERVTTYTYTLNNLIASESMQVYLSAAEPNVTATKGMTYDARGNVTSETDANGNSSYYYYDSLDRMTAMVDANGVMTSYQYDAVGNKTSQTVYATPVANPTIGTQPTPTADAANDRTMTYAYDKMGREISNTIADMVVGTVNESTGLPNTLATQDLINTTRYDANGNIVEITDANNNLNSVTDENRKSTYAYYNAAGEKVAEVDAAGYLTTWTRDAFGNVATEIKYATSLSDAGLTVNDATTLQQIQTTAATLGTAGTDTVTGDRVISYQYDQLNRLSLETKQGVAQGTVDAVNGQLTQTTQAAITAYQYDGLDNITEQMDAVGNVTSLYYDGMGRLTQQQEPIFTDHTGNTSARTTTDMTYDGLGNIAHVIARGADHASEVDDQITTYTYGTGGRLTLEMDALGIETSYGYDAQGNLTTQTLHNRRTADQIIDGLDGADDVTTYTYDNVNRQLATITQIDPDTSITNGVTYNSFGEVIAKSTYEGTAPANPDEFVEYDRAGRVFRTNSEDGVVKVMVYDANGNATIRVTSSDNTASNINTVQNTQQSLQAFINAPSTLQTMSVYDSRNLLTKTIQAAMDASGQRSSIVTNSNSTTIEAVNPLTTSVAPAEASNPVNAGNVSMAGGDVSWSTRLDRDTTGLNPAKYTVKVTVNVPQELNVTAENIAVTVYVRTKSPDGVVVNSVATGYVAPGANAVTIVTASANGKADSLSFPVDWSQPRTYTPPSITSLRLVVNDSNAVTQVDQTWVPVPTQVWVPPGTWNGIPVGTGYWITKNIMPKEGVSSFPTSYLYIKDQPLTVDRLLFSYKTAASNEFIKTIELTKLTNAQGDVVNGVYRFDWSTLPVGAYDFSYVAIDSSGYIINQQSGFFNTNLASSPSTLVIHGQNIAQLGNSLIKVQGANLHWDSDAYSLNSHTGSAYVSARAGLTDKLVNFGLNSDPDTDADFKSIDYSWRFNALGTLNIYVGDTAISQPNVSVILGGYETSDVLAIEYEGTLVNFYKNGQLVHFEQTTANRTFYMDSSFRHINASLVDVKFGANEAEAILLNENSGSIGSTPITPQSPILTGGLGRAFVTDDNSTGLAVNGLQLIDQGANANNVVMRYRVKDSNSAWSAVDGAQIIKSDPTTGFGQGHFSLSTANMNSLFANDTAYEVEFEVYDIDGNLLRISNTEIARDASGNYTVAPFSLNKLRLHSQPPEASYMEIAYRDLGSTASYSTPVRVDETAVGSGEFDWDISGIPNGNQDVEIKSFDASGNLLNHYQATVTFADNSAVINGLALLNNGNDRYITIEPAESQSVEYIIAAYRPKGSTEDYVLLPISTGTVIDTNTGAKAFNVEIPVLDPTDYEYRYTAYGPDIEQYVDPQSITITPPVNTQATIVPSPTPAPTPTPSPSPTPAPSPVPGPSPTPSPSPAPAPVSTPTVIYTEDFNGTNPVYTGQATASGYENGNLYIANEGTANGRLMLNNGPAPAAGTPTVTLTTNHTYTAGDVLSVEVYLGADETGRNFNIGLQGDNGYLYATFNGSTIGSDGNGGTQSSSSLTLNNNTTYIVEIELSATGQTLYVYQQGLTRNDGWVDVRDDGVWNSYQITGQSFEGPGQALSENGLDNMQVTRLVETAGGPTNTSPTVTLAALNATYTEGEAITLTATAADSDGTVASVAFYDGSVLLSTVSTEPYTYTVTNAAVGNHAYTAVAMDDDGATTVSTIATVTVNAPAPSPTPTPSPSPTPSPTPVAIQAKYALTVELPEGYVEGDPIPEPAWIATTATQITAADGSIQYRLDLPADLAEGQYVYEYQTYSLVTDENDPNYDTYQWTDPIQGNFASTIKQTELSSNFGEFTINSDSIVNEYEKWEWVNPNSSIVTVQHEQSFNAFGEIASEKDGRGNITSYTYNALGNLTRKQDPTVSITTETGQVQDTAPVTEYTYDAIGRIIAVKDANGNINSQTWLGNSNQLLDSEYHADGGQVSREYDTFGNLVSQNDAIDRVTQYDYDKNNQLIAVERPSGALDRYIYDEAGNRVAHTNALGATAGVNGATTKMYYDSLGRVTETQTNLGHSTRYGYTYTQAVTGLGGESMSGWVETTTDAVGRTIVDTKDMFGRTYKHIDKGNHTFNYHYNEAGWLTSQVGSTGQDIVYDHYNNGFIKSIYDKALGMYTFYEYDGSGNKSFEGYVSLKENDDINAGFYNNFQQATITYDALNRMISVTDSKAAITYEYDAVGNRRNVKSTYYQIDGISAEQEYWYQYDSMNRFLITKGSFDTATNTIVRGTEGVEIVYDAAGQRKQAINGSDANNRAEVYGYDADGYLVTIHVNGVLRARRINDLLGRTTNITEYANNGTTVSYTQTTTYDADNRTITQAGTGGTTQYYYYDDASNSSRSQSGAGDLARTRNSNGPSITNTYYTYEYWDDAKVSKITADPYNREIKDGNYRWGNGYSDIRYDVNGHISGAIDRVGNRNIRYVSDAQGVLLVRDEITGTIARPNYRYGYYESTYNPGSVANKVERFYYVDGVAVGGVGNDGASRVDYVQAMANRRAPQGNYANWRPVASADFDQNYEPISPTYPGPESYTYTVKAGDTLQSIALTVWGDADMWYLIADANGLVSGQELEPNMELIIPNKVTNIHNNANTYRPYNPGEAIGDLNPTIPATPKPKPKKKGCGGIGAILAAVVTVVVAIVAPQLIPALGKLGGALLGNIAGQAVGIATGAQKGFSFTSLASSVVLPSFGFEIGSPALNAAANAAASNLVSQGLGIIIGEQEKFSWAGLAASAVGGAVGQKVGGKLSAGKDFNKSFAGRNPVATSAITSFASNTASELTRVAIDGGRINWAGVASGTIRSAGNTYAERLYAANKEQQLSIGSPNADNLERRDRYLDMSTADSSGKIVPPGARLIIDSGHGEEDMEDQTARLHGIDDAISDLAADAVNDYYYKQELEDLQARRDALQLFAKQQLDYENEEAAKAAYSAEDFVSDYENWRDSLSAFESATLFSPKKPVLTQDFLNKIDNLRGNPIGGSVYAIARTLGASDQTASIFGVAGSAVDVFGGSRVGGGMLRKRNVTLNSNSYNFYFDDIGRVDFVDAGKLIRNSGQGRNTTAQLSAGGAHRLPDDQGGHYLARIFNGPLFKFNHFAQNGNFNNGAYKSLENYLDNQLKLGKSVAVQIKPSYIGNSERPESLSVRYSIDGVIQKIDFLNRPGGK